MANVRSKPGYLINWHNPHTWILLIISALLALVHYHDLIFDGTQLPQQVEDILAFGATAFTFQRVLLLVPIIYGVIKFGVGGGVFMLVLAAVVMLPRAILSPARGESLFETIIILFTGTLIVSLSDALKRGNQRLTEVEIIQRMLNLQIKRLSLLHVVSGILNKSLELSQVLNAAHSGVTQILAVDAMWLQLWDREKQELKPAISSGLSEEGVIKLGDNLDKTVIQARQPIAVDRASADPIFRKLLEWSGLQSVLSVPLLTKGEVVGTLGVGSRISHRFSVDETDLIGAFADQIGMAAENARLYEREKLAAEAIRVSERNYRELFDNASDAIWVHDFNGTITAVNSAFERLTGYKRNAIIGHNVSILFSPDRVLKTTSRLHEIGPSGEPAESYECELVKKDGGIITVQVGTSLISKGGQPRAFQHIARDITEIKKAQENLQYYIRQVSQAQEAERKRIARELHDSTAQALIAISLGLDELTYNYPEVPINDVREQVRSTLKEVRGFGQQLRPSILDDLGLLPALNWLASDLTNSCGIATELEVIGTLRQLPPEIELMLFRIVQEALTNIRKHSGAKQVCLTIEFSEHYIKIIIKDDGTGFELPARVGDLARSGKLGLVGMQERVQLIGGTLTIDTKPGSGTILAVEVPQ